MHSLSELQEHCSRLAGKAFRRSGGLQTMLWVTQDADGALSEFDMPCSAPAHVNDAAVLKALTDEVRTDFADERVRAYAVAFVGRVTFTGIGCALLAHPPTVRRQVIVVEAHDARASLVATRDIVRGEWPRLGSLQRHERATGRFGDLLTAVHEAAARDV